MCFVGFIHEALAELLPWFFVGFRRLFRRGGAAALGRAVDAEASHVHLHRTAERRRLRGAGGDGAHVRPPHRYVQGGAVRPRAPGMYDDGIVSVSFVAPPRELIVFGCGLVGVRTRVLGRVVFAGTYVDYKQDVLGTARSFFHVRVHMSVSCSTISWGCTAVS